MPAYAERRKTIRPRERAYAFAAVVMVQVGIASALLTGFHVDLTRPGDAVQRLIDVALPKPPPPVPPPVREKPRQHHQKAAPKAAPVPLGGSPGKKPHHATATVTPVVALKATAAPSGGGGTGSGPAAGAGAGGGSGGMGSGGDEGGSDLQQIAGAITPGDYPRHLREAGVGGRVGFLFTVEPNGRVGRCTITRSSGIPELDALTCRLIQERFVYRPSTDGYGRPIEDEVEGEHDWIAHSR